MATAKSFDTSAPPPKLLGPDYFKRKLVTDSDSQPVAVSTPLHAATKPLEDSEIIGNEWQESKDTITTVTSDCHLTNPTYFCTGRPSNLALRQRKLSDVINKTRNTPIAEAAIRREELNRKEREKLGLAVSLKRDSSKSSSCTVALCSSTTRDCVGDWTGWSPNDLDATNLRQPTTRPFVESASTTSSLTISSPVVENFNHCGQPLTCSSTEFVTQASDDMTKVSVAPTAKKKPEQSCEASCQIMDDEVMAGLLQQDEYSRNMDDKHEDWSYRVAKMYQEDLDATAAQELQHRETYSHEDVASGSKYLYKAPPDLGVRKRMSCSSEESSDLAFRRTEPSSPSTGQRMTQMPELSVATTNQVYQQEALHLEDRPLTTRATHTPNYRPSASVITQPSPFTMSVSSRQDTSRRSYHQEDSMDMSYEALLDLEDISCGLSKEVIDYCTNTRSYKEIEGISEGRSCSVCLTDFREGQLVRYLPCLHSFHCHCIDQWLDSHSNCPVCMKSIEELHIAMSN